MIRVESVEDSNTIKFVSEKTRDVEPFSFAAEAHFGEDTFYLSPTDMSLATASKDPLTEAQRYVLGYIALNGPSSKKDIEDNANNCSSGSARNAIYKLANETLELIERVNDGGQGSKAIYDLTEKGRRVVKENLLDIKIFPGSE